MRDSKKKKNSSIYRLVFLDFFEEFAFGMMGSGLKTILHRSFRLENLRKGHVKNDDAIF